MKRLSVALLGLALFGVLLQPVRAETGDHEARELIRKVQDLLRSHTSIATYSMRIVTPEWERTVRLKAWDDRDHRRFFIRILEPARDRDTTWLKDGGKLWMYLPRLERDIRIPPSMMLSSWMGSDFTNDDLVKMESVVDDYRHRILSKDEHGWVVESIPKPDAPVVWGRLVHRIGRDGLPVSEDYYDEDGNLVRRLSFDRVRTMDGRRIPTRWVMQPVNKPGHRTVMLLEQVDFDAEIPAHVFTRANLRRRD